MSWNSVIFQGSLPNARAAHSCDKIQNRVYIFGGWNGTKPLNDLFIFDLDKMSWVSVTSNGEIPDPRNNHATTAIGNKIYLHGGHDGNKWRDDMYILDVSTNCWSLLTQTGDVNFANFLNFKSPTPRACHTLNNLNSKLYLFGGYDGSICYCQMHIFKLETKDWSTVTINGHSPEARNAHTMTIRGSDLILFGGHTGTKHLNDLWIFDTDDLSWTEIKTSGNPPGGLRGHSANLMGNKLVIFGGYDGIKRLNNTVILDLNKMKWSWPNTSQGEGEPIGRQRHSGTLYENNKLLVFGGFDGTKWLNDMYTLDFTLIIHAHTKEANIQNLVDNLYKNLFDKPEFSDYTIVVSGKPIFTHKAILASQSDHFKAMITGGMKESVSDKVVVKDWNYDSFIHVIGFFYNPTLPEKLSLESYLEILQIADAYGVNGLKTLCEDKLSEMITEENSCKILEAAHKFSAFELKNTCMGFIISNFSTVCGTKNYENLEKNPTLLIELTRTVFSSISIKNIS